MSHRLRVIHQLGRAVSVLDGDAPVLVYRYEADAPYPYCHPVHLPGGPPVTLYRPHDHPWHVGLYVAWKYLNGYNVWEGAYRDEPHGAARHLELEVLADRGAGAGVRHTIEWGASSGAPLLRDTRTVFVHRPRDERYHLIDWRLSLAPAAGEVLLDRKLDWGGYAGLAARLPRSFHKASVLNAEGETDPARTHGARSRWAAYAGWVDGQKRPTWGGVAMIDHPANPRYPTPWLTFNSPAMQLFNAAILRDEPLTLAAGERLELSYRVVVHWGEPDARLLDDLADEFGASERGRV